LQRNLIEIADQASGKFSGARVHGVLTWTPPVWQASS
jgi:hypothetical protein